MPVYDGQRGIEGWHAVEETHANTVVPSFEKEFPREALLRSWTMEILFCVFVDVNNGVMGQNGWLYVFKEESTKS